MSGIGIRYQARMMWGLMMILLTGVGCAFAGGGQIRLSQLGEVPPAREFCVMDGVLYAYDQQDDVLVRYEFGADGVVTPGKEVARFPFVLTRMGCGHGRVVGWCGRRGIEGRGLEWVAATGEMRQFQWPPGEVLSVGILPDGVLALTEHELIRWRIGEDPAAAVVLYEAKKEEERFSSVVVDPAGELVALHVFDPHAALGEDFGGTDVMVLKVEGDRARFVSQYRSLGALNALAGGVLWQWDPDTCERGKSPRSVSWRFYPPALLARDVRTGRLLGLWERLEEYGTVRSDGERVIALAKLQSAEYRDPVTVYELVLEVGQKGGVDKRASRSAKSEAMAVSRGEPGGEVP